MTPVKKLQNPAPVKTAPKNWSNSCEAAASYRRQVSSDSTFCPFLAVPLPLLCVFFYSAHTPLLYSTTTPINSILICYSTQTDLLLPTSLLNSKRNSLGLTTNSSNFRQYPRPNKVVVKKTSENMIYKISLFFDKPAIPTAINVFLNQI